MVWVRLADDFPHHPKILKAGPLAGWLWACGLAYANRYATDGLIPLEQVRLLGDVPDADVVAKRLVQVGLWEVVGGGYQIHDFAAYQPSSHEVKREREAAARRQAEYRRRRAEARAIARDDDRNADGDALLTRESQPPGPGPGPGPVKHPSDVSLSTAHGAFAPNSRDLVEAAKLGLDAIAISAEVDAMFDHYAGLGEDRADWHATFRSWLRRKPTFDRLAKPAAPSSRNGHSESIYGPMVTVEGMKT
jgi:hypothetical protein